MDGRYATHEASVELARHCEVESNEEGMIAHARTATDRLERYATEKAGT